MIHKVKHDVLDLATTLRNPKNILGRSLRCALTFIRPRLAYILYQAGKLAFRLRVRGVARKCYTKAVSLVFGIPAFHYALAEIYEADGQYNEALAHLFVTVSVNPNHTDAWSSLCHLFTLRADYPQAELCIRQARQRDPDSHTLRIQHARAILPAGRLEEAIALFDRMSGETPWFATSIPQWDGSDVTGKRVLVWPELDAGYGDQIQMARYLSWLVARGGQVFLISPPALQRLFSTIHGVTVLRLDDLDGKEFDAHVSLSRLMHHGWGSKLETLSGSVPYLTSNHTALLPSTGAMKVGIAWASDVLKHPPPFPEHIYGIRSMPLACLLPVLSVPGVDWYALQIDPQVREIKQLGVSGLVHDLSPQLTDFAETASVIDQLDLVITVDTAVAHLAGALGKPVWIMLPYMANWRWFTGRTDSPWYPTATLFRCPVPGDWFSVVQAVHDRLQGVMQAGRMQTTSTSEEHLDGPDRQGVLGGDQGHIAASSQEDWIRPLPPSDVRLILLASLGD